MMQEIDAIKKEAQSLISIVDYAAAMTVSGSFAQRNPALGKMVTCRFCGARRRTNAVLPCCTSHFAVADDGTEFSTTSVRPRKVRKNPRLTRNRPPFFLIHQRLVEMEVKPDYVEFDGQAGIVEAQIKREIKFKTRRARLQQDLSRRINRGTARCGSQIGG